MNKPGINSNRQVQIQVSVPPHCDDYIRKLAANLGHIKAERGNIRDLLLAIGNAEYNVIPEYSSPESIKYRDTLAELINNRQTFVISTEIAGAIKKYQVLSAEMSIDYRGKHFLSIYTSLRNTQEDRELSKNHYIDIDTIAAISPTHLPWSIFIPAIEVKLWLAPQLIHCYLSHKDDLNTEPFDDKIHSGIVVTRKIYTTPTLISEIIAYGSNCLLMSPRRLHRKIVRQLDEIKNIYRSSAKSRKALE